MQLCNIIYIYIFISNYDELKLFKTIVTWFYRSSIIKHYYCTSNLSVCKYVHCFPLHIIISCNILKVRLNQAKEERIESLNITRALRLFIINSI